MKAKISTLMIKIIRKAEQERHRTGKVVPILGAVHEIDGKHYLVRRAWSKEIPAA